MKDALLMVDQCLIAIRDILRKKTGILLQTHQLENLKKYVRAVCKTQNIKSCAEYVDRLKKTSVHSELFDDLITVVTVGESYFFRDKLQMEFLKTTWLPHIIHQREKSGQKFLRIWSAGCSSGQELYSIAILLKEILPDLQHWHLHLLGTDINTQQLSQAVKGIYTARSLQRLHPNLKERYFKKIKRDLYRLDRSIRNMVSFRYHNLMQMNFPSSLTQTNALDLILCRNVFIYFDRPAINGVMEKFSQCLIPGGYLILGPADFIINEIPGMELQYNKQFFFFERQKIDLCNCIMPNQSVEIDTETTTAEKVETLKEGSLKPQNMESHIDTQYIEELFKNGAWQEVVGYINQHHFEHSKALIYKARALANLGKLQEALNVCQTYLEKDNLNVKMHLLEGMIYVSLSEFERAERAFRQTLFLDPACYDAKLQLGILLIRLGRRREGVKLMKSILKLIDSYQGADQPLTLLNENMQFEDFKDILIQEIRIYEKGI